MSLRYTICFVCHRDHVLLLHRRYPPLAGFLNGVGGKLEPGETPLACVLREVAEETGLRLADARFGGIVTWTGHNYEGRAGMYAYLAELPPGVPPESVPGETEEGRLSWHPLSAVLDGLPGLVSNIPCFLGPMLAGAQPSEYRLRYDGDLLLGHTVSPLPPDAQ
ncbi:MAG TPA: 8-oxo-dGTP diphosphatase [Symbiobacteriaceae bacterium]|nr:8-oxo-dGTP diphosphatase [Symbiobacteriaceae bacterium]